MLEKRLILYIEDDPPSILLVKKLLEFSGYRFINESSGLSGIRTAKEINPDLILLDIDLPDIDGYQVARRLKTAVETGGIPIVALTSSAMKGDREKALSAGCDGYIRKPIDVSNFTDLIELYLGSGE
jgi:two-component system, cell cycle response regulator DivK